MKAGARAPAFFSLRQICGFDLLTALMMPMPRSARQPIAIQMTGACIM